MELAIAGLQSQEKPNYRATAKKHGVNNVTLRRRFLDEQLSPTTAASLYRQSECKVCTCNAAFLRIPFFGGALVNVCLSVHSFMVSQTDFG
jgi:hypothetical protein